MSTTDTILRLVEALEQAGRRVERLENTVTFLAHEMRRAGIIDPRQFRARFEVGLADIHHGQDEFRQKTSDIKYWMEGDES